VKTRGENNENSPSVDPAPWEAAASFSFIFGTYLCWFAKGGES
jgi:hypothetical protein